MSKATPFEPLTHLTGKPLIIDQANVDTDQILPARFLTTTSREGMGDLAFYDWRRENGAAPASHDWLNHTPLSQRRILVAASNFGCGSSREHAPWALYDYGVRAVLGEGVADIFKNNCRKNGIAAFDITRNLFELICLNPTLDVTINLRSKTVCVGALRKEDFEIDDLSRECLMSGADQLGLLLKALPEIERFEQERLREDLVKR